jgi:hypothetical protein
MALLFLPSIILTARAGQLIPSTKYDLFYKSGYPRNWIEFFDEARIVPYFGTDGQWHDVHGWVSLYGAVDGGTIMRTNLFDLTDTTTVNVSWNFTGTDYGLRWIVAWEADGTTELFKFGRLQGIEGAGDITMPDGVKIIDFYGVGPETAIPDSGTTAELLFLGLICLVMGRLPLLHRSRR